MEIVKEFGKNWAVIIMSREIFREVEFWGLVLFYDYKMFII